MQYLSILSQKNTTRAGLKILNEIRTKRPGLTGSNKLTHYPNNFFKISITIDGFA